MRDEHAYMPMSSSVTAPADIGSDDLRSREEWEKRGVYFLDDDCWAQRLLSHALALPA